MQTVLSADWVLPVDGAPIQRGAVAIEDGRIAAVGTSDELGAGTSYQEAVIVPGFVNTHSHLEYAVYAGFGEGLSFASCWGLDRGARGVPGNAVVATRPRAPRRGLRARRARQPANRRPPAPSRS